jgi:ATP-binding cassette subfamily C protein
MVRCLQDALGFLTRPERIKFFAFLTSRSLLALFDLFGILAIGFLSASAALFASTGSAQNKSLDFLGLSLPAINGNTFIVWTLAILFIFLTKSILSIYLTRKIALFLANIEARSAREITKRIFHAKAKLINSYSKEDIYFMVQIGSQNAFNYLLNYLTTVISEGFLFVVILVVFLLFDPLSAFAALIYFGLIGLIMHYLIGKRMYRAGEKVADETRLSNTLIGDLSDVIDNLTLVNRVEVFLNRIYQSRKRVASNFANQYVLNGIPRYVIETSLLIAIGVYFVLQSSRDNLVEAAAALGIFLTGGLRLTASLLPLQSALIAMKGAIPAANSALAILKSKPLDISSTVSSNASLNVNLNEGLKIDLINVGFRYPNTSIPQIDRVNLQIKSGQQVALIGPSGSGKSTIAELILGLLTPSSGDVFINGLRPGEIPKNYPGLLSYVSQSPGMTTGTILENIALGLSLEQVDESLLNYSINAAHLSKLITSLPDGVNTQLGKHKNELSGGQLQRIGLARALYSQPKLLVMDEGTSGLDAESEQEINKALDKLRGTVTVVLIAHRLNTVQRSDQVFLIEDGGIAASGTFSELIKSNDRVKRFASLMAIEGSEEPR